MKLIPHPATNLLCESMQANDMKFVFVNLLEDGNVTALHQFVKCREYFNEFIMANLHEEFNVNETYGFTYDKKVYPWDTKNPHFAIKFMNNDQQKMFMKNLDFLHTIEKHNRFELTVASNVEDLYPITVVKFDPRWFAKCVSFNLYTLILKLISMDVVGKTFENIMEIRIDNKQPSELMYLKSINENGFTNLATSLNEIAALHSKYVDGSPTIRGHYSVHGNSGILTITKLCTDKNTYGLDKSFFRGIQQICDREQTVKLFKEAA